MQGGFFTTFYASFFSSARAIPLPFFTYTHAHTFLSTQSLHCKGNSTFLVVGPQPSAADGCFSAPHGRHSREEGSVLRQEKTFDLLLQLYLFFLYMLSEAYNSQSQHHHRRLHILYLHCTAMTICIHLAALYYVNT